MFQRLRDDIASIRDRDPAARSTWEVLTCYPGLHAVVWHRWAHAAWVRGARWLGRFLSHLGRLLTGIEIHPGATIGERVFIDHGMGVVIGETAEVGDDCTIYQGVTLGGTSLERGAKRHPSLGRGVIVGANSQVLGGFTVGDGARIGSNAVVIKPVPPGATAVGNPARIIERGQDRARHAAAARFAAYGLTDADDPLTQALKGLIDQTAAQEAQIALLWKSIEQLAGGEGAGAGTAAPCVPEAAQRVCEFDAEAMNRLVK